jgi:hypothetical protein
VSGAPGAGKTLVGLKLAFDKRLRSDAVFVTGNSPLVEVLSAALKGAYKRRSKQAVQAVVASGYAHEDAARVIGMSTFKLVKAHAFLGERGKHLESADGRVVIFDEAQRTYRKGRLVLRKPLAADEAQLILESLQQTHPRGAVVVALIGHNQPINSGEMGIKAWFTAAEACGWRFAISDQTLALGEVASSGQWAEHPLRDRLARVTFPIRCATTATETSSAGPTMFSATASTPPLNWPANSTCGAIRCGSRAACRVPGSGFESAG